MRLAATRSHSDTPRFLALAAALGLLAVFLLYAFSQALAGWGVGAALSALGINAHFGTLHVGTSATHADHITLTSRAGEPIGTIGSIDLRYSLRDLLPGGTRQYGLQAVDVEAAHLIVTRHKDGTWNIPIPKANQNAAPSTTPLIFTASLHDSSIDIYDGAQGVPAARHLIVRNINGNADVATNSNIVYQGDLTYVEDNSAYPVSAIGHIDTVAKFGTQHITAAHLPIARIVDFAVNSPSFHMIGGELQHLDARIVYAPDASGDMVQHVDTRAYLAKSRLAIGGVVKPLRDVHGPIAVYDNGLLLQGVSGTLAGAPVQLGGGIYNFSNAQFRLTVAAAGDLSQLKQALAQTNPLPMAGPARLDVLVEGPASKSVDLIALSSPSARYDTNSFGKTSAAIAFDGQEADIVAFHTSTMGVDASARGRLQLHTTHQALQVIADATADSSAIPYAGSLLPAMPLHAQVLAQGDTLSHITTDGVLSGASSAGSLRGAFAIASNGVGTAGPLLITRGAGSLYAIASVDHPHNRFEGYADARRLPFSYAGSSGIVDGAMTASMDQGRISAAGLSQLTNVDTPLGRIAHATIRAGQTAHSPLTVALDASGIGAFGAAASAIVNYNNGTVTIPDAAVANASTFADASGRVSDVTTSPAYDLQTHVHSADIGALAAMLHQQSLPPLEGTANANVHVGGNASAPSFAGSVLLPEGAVNGLAFSSLAAQVGGTASDMTLSSGSVDVGSTHVGFAGSYGGGATRVAINAPHADLADFNDYFDAGDMLAGTGSIAASATLEGGNPVATSGTLHVANAQVRTYQLGTAVAAWHSQGNAIDTSAAFGGQHGHVNVNGLVALNGGVDLQARARDMDLGFWLPMAGITTPVTGIVNATGSARGRYPALDAHVDANVRSATVAGVAVPNAHANVALTGGVGTVRSFDAQLAHATLTASGRFGLRPNDPLALRVRAQTPDIGSTLFDTTKKKLDIAGALDSVATITGTRAAPHVVDTFALTNSRYQHLVVPRIAGTIDATSKLIALRGGEVDLQRGRVLADAALPITLTPFAIDPKNRPISANLVADDVEASNFAALLPPSTSLAGRLDGHVTAAASARNPQFGGALTFSGGRYSGPYDRIPLTNMNAQLAFAGESVTLQRGHADAGGGTIDVTGTASVPAINDGRAVTASFNAVARNAHVNAPAYVKGTVDANLSLKKSPGTAPQFGGTVAMSHARIPLTALYNPAPADAPKTTPPDVGLNLHVTAVDDVRVISPNVDVGATGSVNVLNTLADPQLQGRFTSTDGTVSFYRTFTLENATVNFHRRDGVIPTVDATATTTISNPDTNIALRVTGPATGLNVSFASDPYYDRAQILGLLVNAQALGAVDGVSSSGSSTPFSASSAIAGLAEGQMNTLFTRNLLEPLSDALGKTLGFNTFTLTDAFSDPANLGINARKKLARNLDVVFAETFGEPREQSFTLEDDPHGQAAAYALTVYTSTQARALAGFSRPILVNSLDYANAATMPTTLTGNNGIDFRWERKFW